MLAARNNPHFRRRGQESGPWYISDALAVWPFTQADGFTDVAKANDLSPAGGAVIGNVTGTYAFDKWDYPVVDSKYAAMPGVLVTQAADFAAVYWFWFEWYNQPMYSIGSRQPTNKGCALWAKGTAKQIRAAFTIFGVADGLGTLVTVTYKKWHMLAVSFSSAAKTASYYVNGAAAGTTEFASLGGLSASVPYVGAVNDNGSGGFSMRGAAGWTGLYGRTLTQPEVAEIYAATKGYYGW